MVETIGQYCFEDNFELFNAGVGKELRMWIPKLEDGTDAPSYVHRTGLRIVNQRLSKEIWDKTHKEYVKETIGMEKRASPNHRIRK